MRHYALWADAHGDRQWDGPYPTIQQAKARVPADAEASIVTIEMPMTPPERERAALIRDTWAIEPATKGDR